MQIRIDTSDARPIYRQVADEIKTAIASGAIANGGQLPSVRQLAADLGVNLNTVAAAYRELQSEGLITIRHGSGAVVSSLQTTASSPEDLRRSLRGVLTQMILAGMRRSEIVGLVSSELRGLLK
jgi:GntR family transcriptional regulator